MGSARSAPYPTGSDSGHHRYRTPPIPTKEPQEPRAFPSTRDQREILVTSLRRGRTFLEVQRLDLRLTVPQQPDLLEGKDGTKVRPD